GAGDVAADDHLRGRVALGLVVQRRVGHLHDVDLAAVVGVEVAVQLHDGGGVVDGVLAGERVDQGQVAGGVGEVAGAADGGDVAVEVAPGVAEVGGVDLHLLVDAEVAGGGHVAQQAQRLRARARRADLDVVLDGPGGGRGVEQHLAGRAGGGVGPVRAEDEAEVVLGGGLGVVEGRHRGGEAQIVVVGGGGRGGLVLGVPQQRRRAAAGGD